ncbi:MAG: hypothetical protein JHC28_02985 [Thermoprotei archaeon]|nr:hypothetical protein [Thermoprotei archaeon]
MEKKGIAVIGGGPSGSSFSLVLLSRLGAEIDLRIYDGECPYRKPCGEALLNLNMEIYDVDPPIAEEIRDFHVAICGELIAERHFSSPAWFIINKQEWVESMRAEVKKMGGRLICSRVRPTEMISSLVIDARGPFAEGKRRIPIARAIVEGKEPFSGVLMDFDPDNVGFYWIFPSKGKVLNVGYGSLNVKNPIPFVLSYTKRKVKDAKIREISTSVISLESPRPRHFHSIYAIGEAAGTVFPLTGEGIRPSVIHSRAFAIKLAEGFGAEEAYMESFRSEPMKRMSRQMELQEKTLSFYQKIPRYFKKKLIKTLPLFLDRYLRFGELPLP